MKVTRKYSLKPNARTWAKLMSLTGLTRVQIVGKRGDWTVVAQATYKQLACFARAEAILEQGK